MRHHNTGTTLIQDLKPMPYEPQTWINTLWEALDHVRDEYTDDEWEEICNAMAWNTEALECVDPMRLEELEEGVKNDADPEC